MSRRFLKQVTSSGNLFFDFFFPVPLLEMWWGVLYALHCQKHPASWSCNKAPRSGLPTLLQGNTTLAFYGIPTADKLPGQLMSVWWRPLVCNLIYFVAHQSVTPMCVRERGRESAVLDSIFWKYLSLKSPSAVDTFETIIIKKRINATHKHTLQIKVL